MWKSFTFGAAPELNALMRARKTSVPCACQHPPPELLAGQLALALVEQEVERTRR